MLETGAGASAAHNQSRASAQTLMHQSEFDAPYQTTTKQPTAKSTAKYIERSFQELGKRQGPAFVWTIQLALSVTPDLKASNRRCQIQQTQRQPLHQGVYFGLTRYKPGLTCQR